MWAARNSHALSLVPQSVARTKRSLIRAMRQVAVETLGERYATAQARALRLAASTLKPIRPELQ